MIEGKKIIVVLPAYNAEKTLEKTYQEIPFDVVDDVILVDDKSNDQTVKKHKSWALRIFLSTIKIKVMEQIRRHVMTMLCAWVPTL